jgi:hypothetical protein
MPAQTPDPAEEKSTAVKAAVTEATEEDKPISVEFEGQTYTVETSRLSSIDFFEAMQDNNFALMIRAMLGPAQWKLFKSRHTDITALSAFSDAFGKQAGTGNS